MILTSCRSVSLAELCDFIPYVTVKVSARPVAGLDVSPVFLRHRGPPHPTTNGLSCRGSWRPQGSAPLWGRCAPWAASSPPSCWTHSCLLEPCSLAAAPSCCSLFAGSFSSENGIFPKAFVLCWAGSFICTLRPTLPAPGTRSWAPLISNPRAGPELRIPRSGVAAQAEPAGRSQNRFPINCVASGGVCVWGWT